MNRTCVIGSLLRSGCGDSRGAVALLVAVMLVGIIGFVALGTEIVQLLATARHMQSAADAGALATVSARIRGYPVDYKQEALALAADAGFVNDAPDGTAVTINSPPATGNYTSASDAVEVLIAQPQVLALARVVYLGSITVRARSVAKGSSAANYCILELDKSSTTGVAMTNGAVVNLNQCSLAVNAAGGSALLVNGGAILTTTSVSIGGLASVTNGGKINGPDGKSIVGTDKIKTLQPTIADPYGATPIPTGSGCKYGSPGNPLTLKHSNTGLQTIKADGVYCGGLVMSNDAQVKMNPGTYIIKGGSFNIGGAVKLNGTGVTIVLTGSGSDYATATIGNGATVVLSAPTTGATAGLVFFQNPNAPKTGTNHLEGGSLVTLTGALYFPSQTVVYSNGTSAQSPCTQLVAWQIQFKGGASFNTNCENTGVGPIGGGGQPAMVE